MSIVVPNVGERYWLDRFIKATNGSNSWTLKLYKALANSPLSKTTIVGDFTEAAFPGYAAKTLTPANWNVAATSGTTTSSYNAVQTFTCTGGGSVEGILGYWVVDATTGTLVYAEAFAATENMINNGDAITLTPKIGQG